VQQRSVLKDYAEIYWPVHYKYVEDCDFHETQAKVSRFLMQGLRTSPFFIQWASDIHSRFGHAHGGELNNSLGLDWNNRLGYRLLAAASTPESHLSLACAFGLPKFLKDYALSTMELNQHRDVRKIRHTFLLIAAEEGYDHVVQQLLDRGADVNARGGLYGSAVSAASYGGHYQVMQLLLDKGADIQDGYYGNTLQMAVYGGCCQVVQLLLDKGADINVQGDNNALQTASSGGHYQVVQLLLDRGADVNAQGGFYGNAVSAASYGGHCQMVQLLLDKGADINVQSGFYGNALQAASSGGHDEVVQLLLDQGADINAQGGYFYNALEAASDAGNYQEVQLLLDQGAKINIQDEHYGNALHVASFKGHDLIMQLLLNNGADINLKDTQGREALLLACAGGNQTTAERLLKLKVDLFMTDRQGRNCLHYAACEGTTRLICWLLKQRLDPDSTDRDGWTPLHWAAKSGSIEMIGILKEAGATSRIENIKGWTPASVAIYHDNQDAATLAATIAMPSLSSESRSVPTLNGLYVERDKLVSGDKPSPGIYHQNVSCKGCFMVSQLSNILVDLKSDSYRAYMVLDINVSIAQHLEDLIIALNVNNHLTTHTLLIPLGRFVTRSLHQFQLSRRWPQLQVGSRGEKYPGQC